MPKTEDQSRPARGPALTLRVIAAAAAVAFVLWIAADVLLIIFAGILFAVFLRGISDWIAERAGVPPGWALPVVVVVLVTAAIGGGWLVAPGVTEQVAQLSRELSATVGELRGRLQAQEWYGVIFGEAQLFPGAGTIIDRVAGAASLTFWVVGDFFLIAVVGIYMAAEPDLYVGGVVRLFPIRLRARAGAVLEALEHALRWWLIGRMVSMTVIGVLTWLGLMLLGVPLAATLAVLTALLTFIPIIGPILSAVPPVLIVLPKDLDLALYVLVLYAAVQVVETYVITPLVQREAVSLPPALTLGAQVTIGAMLGPIALALAAPLTVAAMVVTKLVYIRDVLGDPAGGEARPSHL